MALISERYVNDGKASLNLSELQKEYIRIFEQKCQSGEYSLEQRECECGESDFELIAQKDRYGIAVDTVICRNCGLIMTNPCLDEKSNNSFYDKEYPFIYRAEEKPSEEKFQEQREEAEFIVGFIQKHTGLYSGKVLEIGCADGRNVAVFAEHGYDVCGIDLSHTYVEFGKEKGLNLICSDAATYAKNGNTYDLIVLNQVLEHFINPGRELEIIKGMLKPDGYLYIAVPGVKALTFGAYRSDFLLMLQNAHVFNFTRESLCGMMRKYGFDSIFCNEIICGIFQKRESKIVGREDTYSRTKQYLADVEKNAGDTRGLLKRRFREIVSDYGPAEVVLYGTATELDEFVQELTDVSPIRGFFYSDKKKPEEVSAFIRTQAGNVKCLFIIDAAKNAVLLRAFSEEIRSHQIAIYAAYSDTF